VGQESRILQTHPSAAKAGMDFAAFAARLKSCPFKTTYVPEFFRSLEILSFQNALQAKLPSQQILVTNSLGRARPLDCRPHESVPEICGFPGLKIETRGTQL
jgi:hypothetical protein